MPNFADINISPAMQRQIQEIDNFNRFWLKLISLNNTLIKSIPRVYLKEFIEQEHYIYTEKFADKIMEEFFQKVQTRIHSPQENKNYSHLLNFIYDNYRQISISEQVIKNIHGVLLQSEFSKKPNLSQYKSKINNIVVRNEKGQTLRTVFYTALPEETPRQMQEIITWVNSELTNKKIHPLITIGIFIDHFFAIHPFSDGNGRVARLLIVLLMMKSGYLYMPYSSFETVIKSNISSYYRSIYRTNITFNDKHINYEPWLSFFLEVLQVQTKYLNRKIQNILEDPNFINSLHILNILAQNQNYSLNDLAEILNISKEKAQMAVNILIQKNYSIYLKK